MSIRSAASCCQPLQEISVPLGARTVRGPDLGAVAVTLRSYDHQSRSSLGLTSAHASDTIWQ